MGTTKLPNRFDVSARLDSLRDHIEKGLGSGAEAEGPLTIVPLTEAEQKALLRATPDLVFRISLRHNGVTVTGNGTNIFVRTGDEPRQTNDPDDMMRSLCEELAHNAENLMAGFLQTGEVQVLELHLQRDGQTTHYEAMVVAYETKRLLAVVRDVTALREAENSIAGSRDELTRLDEALQKEASLRAEEEEIIRKGYGRLEKFLEDIIEAISLIVQKKDPNTARHQERVSRLACAIGLEMGLKRSQVDVIGLAAILHDLGNVFISAETLAKPGKLSEAEFSAIKSHTETEFQVLKTIDLFFPIADIVHQHHERMDGSGYPLGLKGDDILMEARVIAVADVVEAMVSDRPHRRALGVEAAMEEIASGKGTLYDANAVDACLRLFSEGKFEFDEAAADSPPVTEPTTA